MDVTSYWTHDTALFSTPLQSFDRGHTPTQVLGKVHLEQEHYRTQDFRDEIVPLQTPCGTRTYVHLKPYIQAPTSR